MANPRNLWVRDGVSQDDDLAQGSHLFVDLLFKARTGEPIQGSDVALLSDGPPSAQPALELEPRALFEGTITPQDVTGALVKRIILNFGIGWAPIPALVSPGATAVGDYSSLGWYEGIKVTGGLKPGYGISTVVVPSSPNQSVTDDWLWWNRGFAWQDQVSTERIPTNPVDAAYNTYVTAGKIDTRCRRRLDTWDSTLMYYLEPSIGKTINHFNAVWSVLLECPQ